MKGADKRIEFVVSRRASQKKEMRLCGQVWLFFCVSVFARLGIAVIRRNWKLG
jgi:hypothetical protein